MDCKHFGKCGSCTLDLPYMDQAAFKKEQICRSFDEFFDGNFEFFSSNPIKYRTRAEFGIWHENKNGVEGIAYTMHTTQKGGRILIDECPKVCEPISNLMPKLLEILSRNEILHSRLFGVEFISCSSGILATLLYHKRLDFDFEKEIKVVALTLGITILARSRGQKVFSNELNLVDELNINGKIYKLSLSENAFIQPNKAVNEKMIAWAKNCLNDKNDEKSDLLELYCGHGNFTIPLASCFKRVLATEISKSSIKNAMINCDLNSVKNIRFLRMDADELIDAFERVREFNRLREIDIFAYNLSHILVDPPRAGLSDRVINFIKKYENIIYISCNPQTLKNNLNELCKTHKISKFAIFDQFANTHHIECGVFLTKL